MQSHATHIVGNQQDSCQPGSRISQHFNKLSRLCSVVLLASLSLPALAADQTPTTPKVTQQSALNAYAKTPLTFEPNRGQTTEQVDFVSRGPGYTLFLTKTEAVLSLQEQTKASEAGAKTNSVLRLLFDGANSNAQVSGLEELPGKSNYLIGNNPTVWQTSLPNFAKVQYREVYPGVDLQYYGSQRQLEYDLVVAPGADPSRIAFHLQTDPISSNATRSIDLAVRVDENGNLVNAKHATQVLLHKPTVYQTLSNQSGTAEKRLIDANYVVKAQNQVRIQLGVYDRTQPLVIDPVVVPFYSTYFGGKGNDYGYAIAVDPAGNAYITGSTASLNFPVIPVPPLCVVVQCANLGGVDAFVTELNPAGFPVYSTYLGGAGNDYGYGIAVDNAGRAYVTGSTTSPNFPVFPLGPCVVIQCALAGPTNAFVTELQPGGGAFVYSTYLGGEHTDYGRAITLDPGGNAFVTGYTNSKLFPIFPKPGCFQCVLGGGFDAFVTEIQHVGAGAGLVYSTYLGGKLNDFGYGIVRGANDDVFVTGGTLSPNFPVTAPACYQCVPQGLSDAFVSHVSTAVAGVVHLFNSTYVGGKGNDYAYGIAVDPQQFVYITGSTSSNPFPPNVPCAGYSCVYGGGVSDAFVTKLDPGLLAVAYSTYLGGVGTDVGRGIAVDANFSADVTGYTTSNNFNAPQPNCFQCVIGGANDAFVSSLTPAGNALIYSTYLGGSGNDYGYGIAVNTLFNPTFAFATGSTTSAGVHHFPLVGCFQCANAGGSDAWVAGLP